MKRLILIVLVGCGLVSAQAQSVVSDAQGGGLLGARIGGIVGGNCHSHSPN